MKTKKFQTVYKLTTKTMRSCLTDYLNTPQDVKTFLSLVYSTEHWTIPNMLIPNSGIYVFLSLEEVRAFLAKSRVRQPEFGQNLVCWEGVAFGVRKRKSFVSLGSYCTIERIKSFWAGLVSRKFGFRRSKVQFYLCDGLKLVQIVPIETTVQTTVTVTTTVS